MLRQFLFVFFLSVLPSLSAAQTSEQSPGHGVNPERDIILGSADAPIEMILYTSPGCLSCLKYQAVDLDDLSTSFIEPGDLRLVIRQVPDIFRDRSRFGGTANDESRARSRALALHLHCRYAEGGFPSYLSTIQSLVEAIEESRIDPPGSWPYLQGESRERFGDLIEENGAFDLEAFQTCQQSERGQADTAYLGQVDQFFRSNNWRVVPMVFLNGAPVLNASGEPDTQYLFHRRAIEALITGESQ